MAPVRAIETLPVRLKNRTLDIISINWMKSDINIITQDETDIILSRKMMLYQTLKISDIPLVHTVSSVTTITSP